MKKLLKSLSVLAVMFLFINCAVFQTKREVLPNNTFLSTNPKLMIEMGDGFKYKGTVKGLKQVRSSISVDLSKIDDEYYLWNKGSSYIIVVIKTLKEEGWYWRTFCNVFNKKSVLLIKDEKLMGKKWKTGFWTVKINKWEYDSLKSIDSNIKYDGNYFSKLWSRISSKHIKIYIYYCEKTNNNINTMKIIRKGYTTKTEKVFIEAFNKRADAAITFIK